MILGVRREDKSAWERRAPLVPADVLRLCGVAEIVVQPSPHRAFADAEYAAAGARVEEDLSRCDLVLAIKEIPLEKLRAGGAYCFFSHTIKGQPHNMPLLGALLERGCTLLDWERVTDERGLRLIGFGRHAGWAGGIDALWALGRRLALDGVATSLADLRPAHAYANLDEARAAIRETGRRASGGPGAPPGPLVVGVAGYGNTARGVQEILDLLPCATLSPEELLAGTAALPALSRVTFEERHTVARRDGGAFSLDEFRKTPSLYRADFARYLPRLALLVNCVYWEERFPRLVALEDLRAAVAAGTALPQVIADISCDIRGAIECTVRATDQDAPTYVWDLRGERAIPGFAGPGPTILAVDNLPCELPVDASRDFSRILAGLVPRLARADLRAASLDRAGLPPEIERAAVVWRGALTPRFAYLAKHLN